MEVKATIRPGLNGTKKYLKKCGDQLVCVRYRYDKETNKRQTTVELIVDEQNWVRGENVKSNQVVAIKIDFGETELREEIKTAGAYWDEAINAWLLPLKEVHNLGLEKRILEKRVVEECVADELET